MNLYGILGSEGHSIYQQLEVENGARQYDFLRSLVTASLAVGRPFLSAPMLKALNFHAITCLHTNAGEFRPCPVRVGDYDPPPHYAVDSYVDDFIHTVNRHWDKSDALVLAAYVLWRLNWIHPFINGNGRTARAACYLVLCLKAEQWLPGTVILPELIRQNREAYVKALRDTDDAYNKGALNLDSLKALLEELLLQQLATAPADEAQSNEAAAPRSGPAVMNGHLLPPPAQ